MSLQEYTMEMDFPLAPESVALPMQLFKDVDTGEDALIAAAAVLPEQFSHPPALSTVLPGHITLRWAVLLDAYNLLTRPSKKNGRRQQRLAKETKEWFFTDDAEWPFSFVNLCAALGLDPAYIRRGLLRALQNTTEKRPQRRRYTGRRGFQLAA